MHRAVLSFIDALASADLREGEHAVQHVIRCLQHQVLLPLFHQCATGCDLFRDIAYQRLFALAAGAEDSREGQALLGLQTEGACAVEPLFHHIGAINTFGRIAGHAVFRRFYADRNSSVTEVCQYIFLHHRRQRGGGAQRALDSDRTKAALHRHQPFQRDALHLLLAVNEAALTDEHTLQRFPVDITDETGVCVIGDGAQHGKHQMALAAETALRCDAVVEDHSHLTASHLHMVGMRPSVVGPGDATLLIQSPIRLFLLCLCRQERGEAQQRHSAQ